MNKKSLIERIAGTIGIGIIATSTYCSIKYYKQMQDKERHYTKEIYVKIPITPEIIEYMNLIGKNRHCLTSENSERLSTNPNNDGLYFSVQNLMGCKTN